MDETDKQMVRSALRATVASSPGGVELKALNYDYKELEGHNIPFKALGFGSLEEYIQSLSQDFTIVPKQGSLYVVAKKNDALAHIQDMISGQRAKKKRSGKKNNSFHGKFGRYHTSFNNRSAVSGYNSVNKPGGFNNKSRQGSKPWNGHDDRTNARYDNGHDDRTNNYVPPLIRKPSSGPRRLSPPGRIEPATSNLSRVGPAISNLSNQAHRTKQASRGAESHFKLPAHIQKMPEKLKTAESMYKPAVVPHALSNIMSQIRVNDNVSSVSPMMNLQITLDNDLYTPAARMNVHPNVPMTAPSPLLPHTFRPPTANAVFTPSVGSSAPPSYPARNDSLSTGSVSSSPEVYVELGPNSSAEDQLIHVSKYLFNEEPEIVIRERRPDPKRPVYTYYAFIQLGSHPRICTLPNEFSSKEEARIAIVALALDEMNKLKDERMAKTSKKTTDKLNLLINRIYSLARESSNGVVASKIEELYEEKYGEILPQGWTRNPELIDHPRLEINISPISTIIYAKTGPMQQYSANAALPNLQLPESDEWPVFVNLMTSVSNVFVRLADDSSDAFIKMCEDMDTFMSETTRPDPASKVDVGELYCLNDDGCWHRVRVKVVTPHIQVKFIDHGEESVREIHELFPLYDMFRVIPAQSIELNLPECEAFAELFDSSEVESDIVGKTLVAVIESREPLTATLYNTEEEPNVNINHFIFEQICGLYNVSSLPEENMFKESVFVSFISAHDNCIYVQVESLMFQYLTSSIRQLVVTCDLQEHVVRCSADLTRYRDEIFLAKYAKDEEYYRAVVLEVNPISNNVSVLFIDYGNTDLVSCNNLIKLFETTQSHLCLIPPQAKKVKLAGLELFTPDVMGKLTTFVNGTEPVILKMTAGKAQLHKRDSDGKIVNINALVLGSALHTGGFQETPLKRVTKFEGIYA